MDIMTLRWLRILSTGTLAGLVLLGSTHAQSITNSGFEVDAVPAFPGDGPITGWTSTNTGRTGLNDVNGPFHDDSSIPIPQGSQVGYIQSTTSDGNESLSQTLTGLTAGQRYEIGLYSKARDGGENPTLNLRVGGSSIMTTGLDDDEYRYFRASFTAGSTSETLEILNNRSGNDDTLTVDAVSITAVDSAYVENGSFEYAVTRTAHTTGPTDSAWTFGGGFASGVSRESFNDSAVDGLQVAFLQGTSTISQTLTGLQIGEQYKLSWSHAERQTNANGDNIYNVLLTPDAGSSFSYLSGVDPADENWSGIEGGLFTATATEYDLTFEGTVSDDQSVILDEVGITVIPEPSTLALVGMAVLASVAGWRRRLR